jgi:hypothetical protein
VLGSDWAAEPGVTLLVNDNQPLVLTFTVLNVPE